jgi:outer membrane protein assembly factor BamB
MRIQSLLLLPACLCALTLPATADDWPQWQGPNRDNVSKESGLLKQWPEQGPRLLWTYEKAGEGFSGPAIVGDRLFILGSRDGSEYIFALDVNAGKELWACKIGPLFHNGYGNGPRSTPTVDGDVLYALGGQGNLLCVETATGTKRWEVSLPKDLKGEMMSGWGWSESPLVDGDHLICCPGGKEGLMAALDKKTGKVVWRSAELKDKATYSSVVAMEADGAKMYVQLTQRGYDREVKRHMGAIVGVAARDGKLLWYYPREDYQTAVVPTPIVRGNLVYATAGYGAGCDLLEIKKDGDKFKAEERYSKANRRRMVNTHFGVVLVGDYVYGWSDRGGWLCQKLETGDVAWEDRSNKASHGSLTCAEGRLYCYGESDGRVSLVPAKPEAFQVQGQFKIPRETNIPRQAGRIWTHPVVANGRLYLRDQDLLFCYDVKEQQTGGR